MTLWTPQDLGAKLTQWWDAADYTASTWTDKISSKALTEHNTPTKSSTSFNSAYPGITFVTASQQYFDTTDLSGIPTGSTAGEAVAVFDTESLSTGRFLLSYGGDTSGTRRTLTVAGTTNLPSIQNGTDTLAHNATALDPCMLRGRWSGTSILGWFNGSPTTPSSIVATTLNTATDRFRVGRNGPAAATGYLTAVLSDIFIITGLLTQDEYEKLEGWIAHNRGLTGVLDSGHPYKTNAPTTDQTLTPTLFTNTQTFYAPTITTGSVTLTPSLFTNSQTFFAPTISTSYSLTPALFTNSQTFFAPIVSAGAVVLTPTLFTNTQTFYGPTVALGDPILSPPLLTNEQVFFSPTITVGAVTLTPALFTNTNSFFAPTVLATYSLQPSLLTNEQIFYGPTVTTGPVTLFPSLFTNEQTFPTVTVFAWQSVIPDAGNWSPTNPGNGSWEPIEPTAASWG